MTKDKPEDIKVVFAEGCFDNFEGTQEELDAFVAEINRMVESGEIFEKSQPIDIDNMETEEMIKLANAMGLDLSEFGIDTDIEPRKLQ
jgi:hypothetical protein